MRPLILALGAAFAAAAPPAFATEASPIFHMVRAEIDATRVDDDTLINWDGEAWFGGDRNKLWLKSEGDNGDAPQAELQALWSRNVAEFWDVQAGVRVDIEPESRTYLAIGLQGLAPFQFESEATAFLSEDGDVSARVRQSFDLLFTQRVALSPHIELNAYAEDDAERDIGAGLADVEAGLQLSYAITRKFAPYADLVYERALGETAQRARRAGEDVEETTLRAGIRFWF